MQDIDESEDSMTLYRRFVNMAIVQNVLSRFTSLIYIAIISRLVAPAIYDIVVALALFTILLMNFSNLGFRYSTIHFARRDKENKSLIVSMPVLVGMLVSGPLMILFWELGLELSFTFGFAGRLIILKGAPVSRILFDLQLYLIIITAALKNKLEADLKSDQVAKVDTINSVVQSFLIPLTFFIYPHLDAFFIAYSITMLIPLIMWRTDIFSSFRETLSINIFRKLFLFALPVFAVNTLSTLGNYSARFVVFFEFPEGNVTLYNWVLRFNELLFLTLNIVRAGLFPLLVKHGMERSLELINRDNYSYYKLVALIGAISFGSLVLISRFFLQIILPPEYLSGLELFYIISIGTLVQYLSVSLLAHLQAFAGRKWFMIITFTRAVTSLLFPLILFRFGLNVIATTLFFVYIIEFTYYLIIHDSIKFKNAGHIIYPAVLSVAMVLISVGMHALSGNIFLDVVLMVLYIIITYLVFRSMKIIQEREVDLVIQVLPNVIASRIRPLLIMNFGWR